MAITKTLVGGVVAAGLAGLAAGPAVAAVSPHAVTATRIAGADREGTAIATSQLGFLTPGGAKAVVLARSDQYPDALAGGPLAASVGGPLLLTSSAALDAPVLTEIKRVLPPGGTVYLLGGTAALSDAVASSVTSAGFKVQRLSGADRFATAVAIAQQMGNPATVVEVTGTNFADALSAGPAAVRTHGAILLTNGLNQAAATAAYLGSNTPAQRFAVGGPAAAADSNAFPLYGSDRYATAVVVAQRFFQHAVVVGAATGAGFADALGAGPVVGLAGGPVLLVPPSGALPSSVSGYLSTASSSIGRLWVFGGTAAVGDDVLSELGQAG